MKTFLLDTCSLLWTVSAPEKLSQRARDIIENSDTELLVSHATLWELSIKATLKKIILPRNFFDEIEPMGYTLLPTTQKHFAAYRKLPLLHRDPFDRLLVAQAISENIPLLTCDPEITRYPVKTAW